MVTGGPDPDAHDDEDEPTTVRSNITQRVEVFDGYAGERDREAAKTRRLTELLREIFAVPLPPPAAGANGNGHGASASSLATPPSPKLLIFVRSKKDAERVADELRRKHSVACDAIHGDRRQEERCAVVEAFRSGALRVLVATDVVGRGLDFPEVCAAELFCACRVCARGACARRCARYAPRQGACACVRVRGVRECACEVRALGCGCVCVCEGAHAVCERVCVCVCLR